MAIETHSRIYRAIHLSAVYTVLDPNEFQKTEFYSQLPMTEESYPARHILLDGSVSVEFGSGETITCTPTYNNLLPITETSHNTNGYVITRALGNGAKMCCLFPFTGYMIKHTTQTASNGDVIVFPKMNFVVIVGSDFSVNGKRITDGFFTASVALQDAVIIAHSDIQIIKYYAVRGE